MWRQLQENKTIIFEQNSLINSLKEKLSSVKEQLSLSNSFWANINEMVQLTSSSQSEDPEENIAFAATLLKNIVFSSLSKGENASLINLLEKSSLREAELNDAQELLEEKILSLQEKEHLLTLKDRKILRLEMLISSWECGLNGNDALTSSTNEDGTKMLEQHEQIEQQQEKRPVDSALTADLEKATTQIITLYNELEGEKKKVSIIEMEKAAILETLLNAEEELRKIPEYIIKGDDLRSLEELKKDNIFLRGELGRQKDSLRTFVDETIARIKETFSLCHQDGKSMSSLLKWSESLTKDCERMRKERDDMREMYEMSNSQLSSQSKINAKLQSQIESLNDGLSLLQKQLCRREEILRLATLDDLSSCKDLIISDSKDLWNELDSMSSMFSSIQGDLSKSIKGIAERDDSISHLMAEKLKIEFSQVQLRRECELSLTRATQIESASVERCEGLTLECKNLRGEIEKSNILFATKILDAEHTRRRSAELRDELSKQLSKFESISKALNISESLLKEKVFFIEGREKEIRKLQSNLERVSTQLNSHLKASGSIPADADSLSKELLSYKKLMKCDVCHIRDKDAVITKCMHVFCRDCLDTRIETRQRKCPNCGDPFGASDVRNIYL